MVSLAMKQLHMKKYLFPLFLVLFWGLFIFLIIPKGFAYGSAVDWLSQHTALAETIRTACVEQGTLLPQFLPLGGGSNGFEFSYYGYLRPDIVIGCLFPQIPMVTILTVYMLLGYLVSVLLCYRFLTLELGSRNTAFYGSILFLLAASFFHTHRQVMFVNYMPFLLAALLLIRKKKYGFAAVCLALTYCNSFYYSIAILAAVGWYWFRTEGWSFFREYIKTAFFSCGMAAVLLLPTFLVILEHRRAGTGVVEIPFFLPKMNFLLYSPYGIGLTLLCLYLLLCGLSFREHRADCIFYLMLSSFGVFSWVLNGTLYARGKILIPFLPLVVLSAMRIFKLLCERTTVQKASGWPIWPFLPMLVVLYYNRNGSNGSFMLADFLILFLFTVGTRIRLLKTDSPMSCKSRWLLLIMPLLVALQVSAQESYVPLEDLKAVEHVADAGNMDPLYRFENLYEPLQTGNRVSSSLQAKSSMYSSVTNPDYARFYYDLIKTPIQINNRIALLPEENPFLFQLMGIRYLETTEDKLPEGYRITGKSGDRVTAENPSVMPVAYAVSDVMPEQSFWELSEMERLDALMQTTVVNDSSLLLQGSNQGGSINKVTEPGIVKADVLFTDVQEQGDLSVMKLADGSCEISAGVGAALSMDLETPLRDDILLLEFEVENLKNNSVLIDINGIRNKLSGANAPYPNQNHTFHYQLRASADNTLENLKIQFSSGHYRIRNLKWYTYQKEMLSQKAYTKPEILEPGETEILACTVKTVRDGYFVTSIPYQKGLKLYIDGKAVPTVTVNTAFVGARLGSGMHEIRMAFHAPGLMAGKTVSLCVIILFGIDFFCRSFSKKRLT